MAAMVSVGGRAGIRSRAGTAVGSTGWRGLREGRAGSGGHRLADADLDWGGAGGQARPGVREAQPGLGLPVAVPVAVDDYAAAGQAGQRAIPAGPGQGPAGPRSAPCGRPFPAQTLREKTSQRPGPRPCPPGPAAPGQHPRQDRPWRKRARVCKTGRAAKLPGPRGLLTQIPTASGASPSVSRKTRGSYQIVTSARPARQIHPPLRTCRRRRHSQPSSAAGDFRLLVMSASSRSSRLSSAGACSLAHAAALTSVRRSLMSAFAGAAP